jgi:recombination protein RecA
MWLNETIRMAKKKKKTKAENKKAKSKEQKQKLEAVENAMGQIEKQYGKGSIMKMGDRQEKLDINSISTGCLPLDIALGVGGVPRGRIVEIFGPEASGKTTLILHIIAEAQKAGGVAAFVDAEHALNPQWAKTIGVNLEDLLISQPDTGEQALEIVETLVRSGGLDLILVDSVAALVPKSEIEGEMGDAQVGVQARLMSQALRKLAGTINKTSTCLIFTNQIRHKIGVFFGNPETTSGGLALKFYSSVRIDLRQRKKIKDSDGDITGSLHRAKVIKNKIAPPFKEAEFEIYNNQGISWQAGLIDAGEKYEVVERSGAYYKYEGETLGQGKEAAIEFLKKNPKIAQKIEDKIWEAVKEKASS